jgi:glucose 1-dehydrogenase
MAPVTRQDGLLSGQTAIVTGAGSGIGQGCAIGLGRAGANVVVNFIGNRTGADETVKAITASGAKAVALECDVSDEAQVTRMFASTVEQFGTVDILVNNAGLQADAPFAKMTLAQWNKVIGVNLTGQFLCAREAVREFQRRGPRPEVSVALGKIICMSSVHQIIPWSGHANYATSKGGINMMMQSIAQELAPHKIRVNSVCPGAIQTPINRSAWETPVAMQDLLTLIPYKRIGKPEDIARVVVYLASDQSDYINGTSIYVDGGMTLFPGFSTGGG